MKNILIAIALLTLPLDSLLAADENEPAEVLMIGVFHFANPQRDVVKTDVIDVLSEDSQAYLEDLSQRIADLEPTAVLLEYNPENQAEIQAEYNSYRAGQFELTHNEIYQLGFRIAAKAGLETVQSFDEREVGWEAQALFKRLEEDGPTKAKMDHLIAQVTEDTNRKQATLSLGPLLRTYNTNDEDRLNRSFYVVTNHLGAGTDFVGADAAASWWHRNFRMYARIQHHSPPGSRVVVIGGQGHTAILRGLLEDDPDRTPLDPLQVLQ